jgi:hypothetical protein
VLSVLLRFTDSEYPFGIFKPFSDKNRSSNQEWAIQRHWQHWAHKTQDEDIYKQKRNTTQKRKKMSNTLKKNMTCGGSVLLIFLVFCVVLRFCLYMSSSSVLCAQCCQCLCIAHSWLPLRFLSEKGLKIPKGYSESVNGRRTDSTMAKRISTWVHTRFLVGFVLLDL